MRLLGVTIGEIAKPDGRATRTSAATSVVANIPSVDPKGDLTIRVGIDPSLIARFNLLLPKLAADAGASFIDLNKAVSAEGMTETIDGVHLAPRAYDLWDAAMLAVVKRALGCSANGNER